MGIYTNKDGDIRIGRVVLTVLVFIVFLVSLASTFVTVPAGSRGVVLNFGAVEPTILDEGLHTITPFRESVVTMSVQTQKYEVDATAASKDLQDTMTKVAVNYHIDPMDVNKIYQQLGINYQTSIIAPAVQEVVKATTAQYNAEELITERPLVKDKIEAGLKDRLTAQGILVDAVSITDFQFSQQFSTAIEAKVEAQQLALKAENDLQRITIEAQQSVAKAKGDAQAIDIIQQQLAKSPTYIQWYAVSKWSGTLPQVTGGAIPFINLALNQTGGA
jgi:regulator of protease activity HflC (stomatin/prohibitin superfamily)